MQFLWTVIDRFFQCFAGQEDDFVGPPSLLFIEDQENDKMLLVYYTWAVELHMLIGDQKQYFMKRFSYRQSVSKIEDKIQHYLQKYHPHAPLEIMVAIIRQSECVEYYCKDVTEVSSCVENEIRPFLDTHLLAPPPQPVKPKRAGRLCTLHYSLSEEGEERETSLYVPSFLIDAVFDSTHSFWKLYLLQLPLEERICLSTFTVHSISA
jgi:hypothetical protein